MKHILRSGLARSQYISFYLSGGGLAKFKMFCSICKWAWPYPCLELFESVAYSSWAAGNNSIRIDQTYHNESLSFVWCISPSHCYLNFFSLRGYQCVSQSLISCFVADKTYSKVSILSLFSRLKAFMNVTNSPLGRKKKHRWRRRWHETWPYQTWSLVTWLHMQCAYEHPFPLQTLGMKRSYHVLPSALSLKSCFVSGINTIY